MPKVCRDATTVAIRHRGELGLWGQTSQRLPPASAARAAESPGRFRHTADERLDAGRPIIRRAILLMAILLMLGLSNFPQSALPIVLVRETQLFPHQSGSTRDCKVKGTPIFQAVRDFACLATCPLEGLPREHAKSGWWPAQMAVRGYGRTGAFRGGRYGYRYRQVLQLAKGLWLHSAGQWRPRRVRSCFGGRTRRNARPRRGSEAHLRHRSRSQERQVCGHKSTDRLNGR